MKYFKVKKQYDNYGRSDGSILVQNELYTEKEVKRFGIMPNRLEEVDVKKNQTYFMFGARFCKDCGYGD